MRNIRFMNFMIHLLGHTTIDRPINQTQANGSNFKVQEHLVRQNSQN